VIRAFHPQRQVPASLVRACRSHGILPSRYLLVIYVRTQTMQFFEAIPYEPWSSGRQSAPSNLNMSRLTSAATQQWKLPGRVSRFGDYQWRRSYLISTSRFGVGQQVDSCRTPLGLHRIAEKIGGGFPIGAVFEGRVLTGCTWQGKPDAPITHRILWLDGLEPGWNRGNGVDTHARYIYLHGFGDETTLGRPVSPGCIHVAGADLLPLFDRLPSGTLVWITEK